MENKERFFDLVYSKLPVEVQAAVTNPDKLINFLDSHTWDQEKNEFVKNKAQALEANKK